MNLSGVEPWTFEQRRGEAIFIPAGCPHQVRNLKVSFFFTLIYNNSNHLVIDQVATSHLQSLGPTL